MKYVSLRMTRTLCGKKRPLFPFYINGLGHPRAPSRHRQDIHTNPCSRKKNRGGENPRTLILTPLMADADAALPTPPPEVVAPEEHPVGAESTVAAPAEVDNKRKLEEVSADAEVKGTSEDAKRPRVDGEPDAATGGSLGPPLSGICGSSRFYL
jgi:hypothetical protein